MSTPDVLLAGAGIIGLSAALELATHGVRVTVLERGSPMREASWAAAGMLAAHDPENPPVLLPFAAYSLALYPRFLAQVEHLSGVAVPLRTRVTLQQVHAHTSVTLSPAELQATVPGIAAGRYIRLDEQSLDPRDLCTALPRACAAACVTIRTGIACSGVRNTGFAVEVLGNGERFAAAAFLDCRGAWAGREFAQTQVISPCKGQMLTVFLPQEFSLPAVIRTPELYLVPRGDRRVIIGATVENVGYDKQVHAADIGGLFAEACKLWPPLAAGHIVDSWAGLRPATADGLPILDAAGPRCWVAAGHYRNGILLAPGTARLMRQLVLGDQPDLDLDTFCAARFNVQHDKQLTATL